MGLSYLNSTIDVSCQIKLLKKNFISFTFFKSIYQTGAAHGYYWTSSYNYTLNPLVLTEINDIFIDDDILKSIDSIVIDKLRIRAKQDFQIDNYEDVFSFNSSERWGNYSNFFLSETSIWFVFNPYQISAFYYGDHIIEVTFDELKALLLIKRNC